MTKPKKTMVEITINYDGQLRCISQHGPSSTRLETDAPVDNKGRGESFSPTDLVATALGTCMATIMGIVADQRGIDLAGMRIVVQKEMSADLPRRISALHLQITMPISEGHPDKEVLVQAGLNCPVQHSIHSDIEVQIDWVWAE
ncbi:OsmC family protein [Akkermansiaceae bacterium]|nr:OsmC family protein [Akkermansiaceae bacterium]